jgi:hypothetical protein
MNSYIFELKVNLKNIFFLNYTQFYFLMQYNIVENYNNEFSSLIMFEDEDIFLVYYVINLENLYFLNVE